MRIAPWIKTPLFCSVLRIIAITAIVIAKTSVPQITAFFHMFFPYVIVNRAAHPAVVLLHYIR
jgi:hypothetical protein